MASRCDTEILPHLYERDGERYPERLRGKFAIAVWDGPAAGGARPRPARGQAALLGAAAMISSCSRSELKSLLASGLIEPELDYEAIDAYLTFGFVPGPAHPARGVHKLLPGHRLIIDADGVRAEAYWRYPTPEPDRSLNEQEHTERLLELLEESVRLRLMSDVPLGAMLSGGLDSSLIVALMARNMSEPVKTFSVGFREAGEGNELADARLVANHFGTDHHELELCLHDQQIDLAQLAGTSRTPRRPHRPRLPRPHPTRRPTRHRRPLGPRRRRTPRRLHEASRRRPDTARAEAPAGRRCDRADIGTATRRTARTLAADDRGRASAGDERTCRREVRRRLYVARSPTRAATRRCASDLDRLDGFNGRPLPTTLYVDAQLALVDDMLHYFDRASMAHSLEVRVPFLDHQLVEYCATIPDDLKVRRLRGSTSSGARRQGIVPDRVLEKTKVGFFIGSMGSWFRAQAGGAINDYLLDRARATQNSSTAARSSGSSANRQPARRSTIACSSRS